MISSYSKKKRSVPRIRSRIEKTTTDLRKRSTWDLTWKRFSERNKTDESQMTGKKKRKFWT